MSRCALIEAAAAEAAAATAAAAVMAAAEFAAAESAATEAAAGVLRGDGSDWRKWSTRGDDEREHGEPAPDARR